MPKIQWLKKPKFDVVDDGYYNRFECTISGVVRLTPELELRFVPGWITDFTTGNWFSFLFVPQNGPHVPAALVHDLLLNMGFSRKVARYWMRRQLRDLDNVGKVRRFLMPLGVWVYDFVKYGE